MSNINKLFTPRLLFLFFIMDDVCLFFVVVLGVFLFYFFGFVVVFFVVFINFMGKIISPPFPQNFSKILVLKIP